MKGKKMAAAIALVVLLLALGTEAEPCSSLVETAYKCKGNARGDASCYPACAAGGYTGSYCGAFYTCVCINECGGGSGGRGEAPPPEWANPPRVGGHA